ncbi:MAG: helix-turn-helix transcriptional regulator [Thermoplasmata archaeon]|nr:helix-turn-helix transcriptional regulator [Thermoplasmata archaeon]
MQSGESNPLREKLNREMRSGLYALFILKAVEELGDTYGYEIVKYIEERSGGRIKLRDATVYPILRYFTKRRVLESYWTEPDVGLPRKYYRLTPDGRRFLKELFEDYRDLKSVAERILEGDGR